MPRYARQLSQNSIYHVMLRGIGRMDIFLDDEDRLRFLDTIDRMMENGEYEIYAYCLMSNHVHLLLKDVNDPIKRSIKRIGVSYAYYFNKKYNRVSHVFQDRFRSEIVSDDIYFMNVSRYIHNNPVKTGIVNNADDYYWSSMRNYINVDIATSGKIKRNYLLRMFSNDESTSIRLLKEFTEDTTDNKFLDIDFEPGRQKNSTKVAEVLKAVFEQYKVEAESIKAIKNKALRDNIIRDIKEKTTLSVRDLSKILDISKDIIHRA